MKAKRILSILLTGSMLLSLLPVSALAAAPVFDAPAQTTAKKAAPLVQEADASRSTEEEAATRSSRDLDAENGTAESITIQLNAEGKPADSGDLEHWVYSGVTHYDLKLYQGIFTLQPSSEPGAESALQENLYIYKDAEFNGGTVGSTTFNNGTISGGTFQKAVHNDATPNNQGLILDGIFKEQVYNSGTISNGNFQGKMYNSGTISGGIFKLTVTAEAIFQPAQIEGGTFEDGMKIYPDAYYPTTITDGLFNGKVSTEAGPLIKPLTISGGLFTKAVDVSNITNLPNLQIIGGYFVNEPTLPEGSDIAFTTVSDQSGKAFQVPVNDGFSENSYTSLFVPRGSSAQPNPITVKTAAPLIDCLADGVSIMDNVRTNADGSYTIDVYSPASIVLVTEEPAPPTPDKPTPPTPDKPVPPTPDEPGELDPGLSSGAAALGIVLGTAGLGYATYVCGSSLYLHHVLPDGFIPSTRQELATVLWTTAGKPDPVSTALYTDIPADAIEQQKAARWCAEQGLLSDHGATFGPDTKVTNARIIRAWNSLKKVPVTIK